jgi:cytochrome c-type biogenesis protein CcmE
MSALKAKHQRLLLVVVALVALTGAALLAIWGLRSQASYFYIPSETISRVRSSQPGPILTVAFAWVAWSRRARSGPSPTE